MDYSAVTPFDPLELDTTLNEVKREETDVKSMQKVLEQARRMNRVNEVNRQHEIDLDQDHTGQNKQAVSRDGSTVGQRE